MHVCILVQLFHIIVSKKNDFNLLSLMMQPKIALAALAASAHCWLLLNPWFAKIILTSEEAPEHEPVWDRSEGVD